MGRCRNAPPGLLSTSTQAHEHPRGVNGCEEMNHWAHFSLTPMPAAVTDI